MRQRVALAAAVIAGLAHAEAIEPSSEAGSANEGPAAEPSLHVGVVHGRVRASSADGYAVPLSVRPDLQQAAFRWLKAAQPVAAAAILVHVPSGRVLVWQQYTKAGDHSEPLTDLAPAASLFKLVTATALLEETPVVPTTRVCIDGGERRIMREHLLPARGPNASCDEFERALGYSRNAVFAQLASHYLNAERLQRKAVALGFNAPARIELPVLFGRLEVPNEPLAFARTAAGFKNSRVSPVGVTQLAYTIARGGMLPTMTLLADVATRDEQEQTPPRVMQARTASRLARMMEVTVHSGTSLRAFSDEHGANYLGPIRVAGKTGTLRELPEDLTTSWFTGFAPSRDPEVVVTVLLRNGPLWRRKANQIARDLLRAYFAQTPGVTAPE